MSATGYIQVHTYTSYAQLPLENVAVTVTATDGTAIAMRLTDRSGRISPIEIPVPDRSDSLTPDPPEKPFAVVNLYAHRNGYEQFEIEDMQVFADIVTDQELEMIPLAEFPSRRDEIAVFPTPPQNL